MHPFLPSLRRGASSRVLLGAIIASVVAITALVGGLSSSAAATRSSNCANIERFHLEKQMNAHAAQILASCGRSKAGSQAHSTSFSSLGLLAPATYGGPDVNEITGPPSGEGAFPHVTQSETQTWAQGNTVVTTMNDSRTAPSCYSGGSYSIDNGVTFIPLNTRPFCSGHGTGYGDPVVVYDQAHAKWIAVFLASGCGGQGMGVWSSVDGITWTTGSCAHNGGSDDRESGYVDNNPSSPFYGRMYLSWNNFAIGGGALQVISLRRRRTDLELARDRQRRLRPQRADHRRPGRHCLHRLDGRRRRWARQPHEHRSTARPTAGRPGPPSNTGAAFPGPGQSTCGYFAAMFPSYWRHMGWGDIGAGPSGSHPLRLCRSTARAPTTATSTTCARPTTARPGATPLKLNTDGGTRSQWQPSLSVSPGGNVLVSWYDARNTTGNSFERFARLSPDNGATWGNDEVMSDAVSPLPLQPDGSVQACYTGDYDRSYSNAAAHYVSWVDGRVLISGTAQQDVFFDKHPVGPPPPPAPNLVHDLTTLFDGNSNGYIDPGESFGLDERVRNAGNADAHAISGVLTSPTPGITITTGNSAYPDIPAGGMGTNSTRFQGNASGSIGCGGDVSFHLVLTATEGTYNVNFTVPTAPCPNYTITTQTGPVDRPRDGRHRQPLRRLHDCDHVPVPGLRLRAVPYTSAIVESNGTIQFDGRRRASSRTVPAGREPTDGRSSPTGTTCTR